MFGNREYHKNIVIFSDDSESGIIGEVPEVNDPKIGILDWNKTPIVEICGLKKSKKMIAAQGASVSKKQLACLHVSS